MFTKIILFAVLAACGVPSTPATTKSPNEQPDKKPPDDEQMDQHFCCQSVDLEKWTGDGCVTIEPGQINACNNVLYCEGNWGKRDGKVICEHH